MRVAIDARLVSRGLGIAQFVVSFVRHLSDGIDVVWIGDPALAPPGAECPPDVSRWPYPLLDSAIGRRWARRAGVDLVHFTGNTGWMRPCDIPFVLTVQDTMYFKTGLRHRSLRQIVGHRYARRVVCGAVGAATVVASPSTVTAEAVSQLLGRVPVVVPYGIDVDELTDIAVAAKQGDYAVAFAGRDPRKGLHLAVEGWRAAGGSPSRLVLFGGAGLPNGSEALLANDKRIEVRPYLPRRELLTCLAGAAVLIYPSLDEGFGLPVLEAMALGVPVVSGLARAVREVAGPAILTIDPAAPVASIAGSLRRLASDVTFRQTLTEQAFARASTYTWARTAAGYENLYAVAASEPPVPPGEGLRSDVRATK